jgi:predicted Zn-dependent protease
MSPEQEQQRQLLLAAVGLGAQLGVLLPYSRAQESEGDEIGLMLMAAAGFDPRAAVQLWRNMAEQTGGQPPEFLSTHPSHQSRIERISRLLPKAEELYRSALANRRSARCPSPV